jgi:tryptophan-rich sensory protein
MYYLTGLIVFAAIVVVGIITVDFVKHRSRATKQEFEEYQQQLQNPQATPLRLEQDAPSVEFGVLGFFLPVVGLVLHVVWREPLQFRARSVGRGALVGVIVEFVVGIAIWIAILCI